MPGAAKLDLRKALKAFYAPAKGFALVEVPPINFIMIDGKGAPTMGAAFGAN